MPIAILSDEELDTILGLLRREAATLNDDGGICERLVRLLRRAPDTEHVYMVTFERACYGLWTSPREAVEWLLSTGNPDGKSIDDAMEEMLSWDGLDQRGYEYLHKIPINPTKPWHMAK